MKRIAIFLLAAATMFGGCSNNATTSVSEDQTVSSTPQTISDNQVSSAEQNLELPVNSEGATEKAITYLKEQYNSDEQADNETKDTVQRL